ncbi:MAG: hypothetical protein ACQZ3N_00175, partial [cyanobacterium endosymbiont of Rhopalodia yunnanensis]
MCGGIFILSFLARYRFYQGKETFEDNSKQGQWTFDGKILRAEGKSRCDLQKILTGEGYALLCVS